MAMIQALGNVTKVRGALIFVEDIEGLHADLAARGVAFRSDGPIEKSSGGKSLYSLDPDGYVVEFHERVR